jgi:hypothetical protein
MQFIDSKARVAIIAAGAVLLVLLLYTGRSAVLQASSTHHPGLEMHVQVPGQTIVGQPVNLRLVVSNSSGSAINLSGGDPNEAYAFVAYDEAGRVVWYSLHDQPLSGVLANWTIAPHDEVSHEVSWFGTGNDGQPLPAGDYTVTGRIFLSDDESPESPPAPVKLRSSE